MVNSRWHLAALNSYAPILINGNICNLNSPWGRKWDSFYCKNTSVVHINDTNYSINIPQYYLRDKKTKALLNFTLRLRVGYLQFVHYYSKTNATITYYQLE